MPSINYYSLFIVCLLVRFFLKNVYIRFQFVDASKLNIPTLARFTVVDFLFPPPFSVDSYQIYNAADPPFYAASEFSADPYSWNFVVSISKINYFFR